MVIVVIIIGIIVIMGLCLALWLVFMKKRWNLKVEFKMIRSNGLITIPEWGKGRYDANNGIIYVKRKRKRAEAIKAKRLDKYLQGANTITVVGNPGSWMIVIPESYLKIYDEETGEGAAYTKIKADTREDKSWATNFERMAKQAFTISSFMTQYGRVLEIAFIILITVLSNFIGFSLVLSKLKG